MRGYVLLDYDVMSCFLLYSLRCGNTFLCLAYRPWLFIMALSSTPAFIFSPCVNDATTHHVVTCYCTPID